MPIHRRVDASSVLRSHNRILCNSENECSTQEHDPEQKEPDKTEYTPYDPVIGHSRIGEALPWCWKSGLWKGRSQKRACRLLSAETVEGALEYSLS